MTIINVSILIDDRHVVLLIPKVLSVRAQDYRNARTARPVSAIRQRLILRLIGVGAVSITITNSPARFVGTQSQRTKSSVHPTSEVRVLAAFLERVLFSGRSASKIVCVGVFSRRRRIRDRSEAIATDGNRPVLLRLREGGQETGQREREKSRSHGARLIKAGPLRLDSFRQRFMRRGNASPTPVRLAPRTIFR
jgi:hypothetical protein